MDRKFLLNNCFALLAVMATFSATEGAFRACARTGEQGKMSNETTALEGSAAAGDSSRSIKKLEKPKEEWRRLLTQKEYAVLFEEDTEHPFTSPLNQEKREGTFICAACNQPLFSSEAKFESGTGWPSFFQPVSKAYLGTTTDYKLMVPRTEYHCARCGGHQGHVFDDGPPPTGKRFCNNGVALKFVPKGEALPHLRN